LKTKLISQWRTGHPDVNKLLAKSIAALIAAALRIGNATEIKTQRVRKQKTDRADALLLLKLLLENHFPQIWVPSPDSRLYLAPCASGVENRCLQWNKRRRPSLNEGTAPPW
jgi:hypothetical protein